MAKKTQKPKERVLLVKDETSEFKVTIPPGARITFGPDVPFAGKANMAYEGKRCYSLRVYEGKTNDTLIACFSRVQCFRDIAMPHARLVVREAGKSMWKSDETGYEVSESLDLKRQFVDSAKLLAE